MIAKRTFSNRIQFIEEIHCKCSQSKDYRLLLVRLVEALLKPALALKYIVHNSHIDKDMNDG
jgi:two-component sensor histidine kinase